MEALKILAPALRQYRHNKGPGLLFGFELNDTQKIVQSLQSELKAVKAENKSLREFFYVYVEHIGEHLPGCDGGAGDCKCKCKINELLKGR